MLEFKDTIDIKEYGIHPEILEQDKIVKSPKDVIFFQTVRYTLNRPKDKKLSDQDLMRLGYLGHGRCEVNELPRSKLTGYQMSSLS